MMKKHLLRATFLCLFLAFSIATHAQINHSKKERLNDGWEFIRQDLGSIWEAVRPAAEGSSETVPLWHTVTLPHCFNAEDSVDPDVNYYQGAGWYKTLLSLENPYRNGRILLHFEGAGQKSEVYVYTEKVGSHVGGYDEWTVDITDAVAEFLTHKDAARFKGKVPLSIRCDNGRDTEMIPSDLSDFNLYGGIYRYLNLVYVPGLALDKLQINASTDAQGKTGEIELRIALDNLSDVTEAELVMKIYNPQGKLVKQETKILKTLEDEEVFNLSLTKPTLWDVNNPNLYRCEISLKSDAGNVDYQDIFGFRHFEFQEKGPFFLNGKRLLLRGTHRHEDHAGVAAAMTQQQIVEEMEMMKSMGVNFIRLGHYQQSRIVLEQCDRLGILVWEEIPWCRGGLGGEIYKEQARRMLSNMITQHRNHPSIILWGLGNENDWPNDFPEFDKDKIRAFMSELHTLSHEIDDTRLTSIRRCEFCSDIVDVYSPSIWAGWYRGVYSDYQRVSYNEMQKVKRFLHVEWGGDNHARRYAEDPYVGLDKIPVGKSADERAGDASLYGGSARASRDGDWSESYIVDLIDWHLKEQETMEWLTGAAYWPFKDFSTPVRPENPVPYMNQKGVMERDLTPKEAFYVFQSYWTEEPMVHVYGQNWTVRWGEPDELKTLKVYSNCEQVELFLNEVSLGVKRRDSQDFPAAGLRWESKLVAGENRIKAVATTGRGRSKTTVENQVTFEYETRKWGAPEELHLSKNSDGAGVVWIEAEIRDSEGVVCLDSQQFIFFDAVGDGELVRNRGTSTGSSKVQAYNGRAKIRLETGDGESVVSVKSEGLATKFITVK